MRSDEIGLDDPSPLVIIVLCTVQKDRASQGSASPWISGKREMKTRTIREAFSAFCHVEKCK